MDDTIDWSDPNSYSGWTTSSDMGGGSSPDMTGYFNTSGAVLNDAAGGVSSTPETGGGGGLSGIAGLFAGGGSSGGGGGGGFGNLLSAAGGIYGLMNANQLQGMAKDAFSQANPFGGYRAMYGQQLADLMNNPSSVTSLPGYQFEFGQGQQAVERGMSKYRDSGNEAIALQEYGQGFAGQYLQQQEQLLSGLAGANITPNQGPAMQGYLSGTNLAGSALNNLAYGSTRYGGASSGTPAYGGGGFNSAGGEAAGSGVGQISQDIGAAKAVTTLAGDAYKWSGSSAPSEFSSANRLLGDASNVLGIYSGLTQGGWKGDTSAALNATQLASKAGLIGAGAGAVAGEIAAPLAVYNAVSNWQPHDTGGDTLRGAEAGAAIGSIVPGVGTVIGGVVGGAVGLISSFFGHGYDSSEHAWKDFYQGHTKTPPQNLNPKYTMAALSGLWRGASSHATGLQNAFDDPNQFTTEMASVIDQGVKSGKINASTSVDAIFSGTIYDWLAGKGLGRTKLGTDQEAIVKDIIYNYKEGRPITWGDASGGKPTIPYTPFSQISKGGNYINNLPTSSKETPVAKGSWMSGMQNVPMLAGLGGVPNQPRVGVSHG